MTGLGASAALDKRARSDANCSPDKKRLLSPKPEKRSRGAWGLDGRGDISVAVLSKRKRGEGRLGADKRCLITRLEKTAAIVDNPGDLTILLS